MSLCYYCGRDEETTSCPHCGISYCKDHLDPKAHKCMVYKGALKQQERGSTSGQGEVLVELPAKHPKSKQQHNKVLIAVGMIMISLSSMFLVAMSAGGAQGLPGVTPSETDYGLHSVALGQVNVYRFRDNLPDFEYDISDVAQEWAAKLVRSGELSHNPDLPSNMGENVAVRTEKNQDPTVTIAMMVQDMVVNDVQYNNANRANILGEYDRISIGVAVKGNTVVLVLNFG